MTDITIALTYGWPGCVWKMLGDEYDGLEWLDTRVNKPTMEEIDAAYARYKQSKPVIVRYEDKLEKLYQALLRKNVIKEKDLEDL